MKTRYHKLCSLLSGFLVNIALSGVKPASAGWAYQPKVPKCLK